ncbi:MAG: hypothetical protein ACPGGK_15685 [Pikeienuella sp.]
MFTFPKTIAAARGFAKDTSGAITVDWVALTAAVVIVGIGIVYTVYGTDSSSGVNGLMTSVNTEVGTASSNIDGALSRNVPAALTD